MWELFAAIFGCVYLASKIQSDKSAQREAREAFDRERRQLDIFRRLVTDQQTVFAVNEYMRSGKSNDQIVSELRLLFDKIPELKGKENHWLSYNHKPPAGNWSFIELVLCINRRCVPITRQYGFQISPYYIGNSSSGVPMYISLSAESCAIFADWVTNKFQSYGINVVLTYNPSNSVYKFVWETDSG